MTFIFMSYESARRSLVNSSLNLQAVVFNLDWRRRFGLFQSNILNMRQLSRALRFSVETLTG